MREISAVERTMGYPETELTSCRVGTSTAGQKRGKIANSATRSGSVERSACILGSFGFCYGHPETERNRRIDHRWRPSIYHSRPDAFEPRRRIGKNDRRLQLQCWFRNPESSFSGWHSLQVVQNTGRV